MKRECAPRCALISKRSMSNVSEEGQCTQRACRTRTVSVKNQRARTGHTEHAVMFVCEEAPAQDDSRIRCAFSMLGDVHTSRASQHFSSTPACFRVVNDENATRHHPHCIVEKEKWVVISHFCTFHIFVDSHFLLPCVIQMKEFI